MKLNAVFTIRVMLLCLLLLTISLLSLTLAVEPPSNKAKNIAAQYPASEVMWLDSQSGQFLALHSEYIAKAPKGIAIFLTDLTEPFDHNQTIEPLRQQINYYGWTSLTIDASDIPPLADKEAVNKAPANAELGSENTKANNQLIERLLSAQQWAASRTKKVILVMEGRRVAYLIDALLKQYLHPLHAVIILDADVALASNKNDAYPMTFEQLSMQLVQLKTPLLDIYQRQSPASKEQMAQRQLLSIKHRRKNYRQFFSSTSFSDKELAKIIYGWLKTTGY